MIAFRDQLDDHQLADVVSFVRANWGNKAAMVSPSQVGKIRDKTDPVRYYEIDLLRMR
jgi:mono/diheme cytochrome c family protein